MNTVDCAESGSYWQKCGLTVPTDPVCPQEIVVTVMAELKGDMLGCVIPQSGGAQFR